MKLEGVHVEGTCLKIKKRGEITQVDSSCPLGAKGVNHLYRLEWNQRYQPEEIFSSRVKIKKKRKEIYTPDLAKQRILKIETNLCTHSTFIHIYIYVYKYTMEQRINV